MLPKILIYVKEASHFRIWRGSAPPRNFRNRRIDQITDPPGRRAAQIVELWQLSAGEDHLDQGHYRRDLTLSGLWQGLTYTEIKLGGDYEAQRTTGHRTRTN